MADKNKKTAKTAPAQQEEKETGVMENSVAEEPKKAEPPAEDLYSLEELAAVSRTVFGVNPEVTVAALKMAGKTTCSVSEAAALIKKFLEREVK